MFLSREDAKAQALKAEITGELSNLDTKAKAEATEMSSENEIKVICCYRK